MIIIQTVHDLHVGIAQRKIKNVEILLNAILIGGFWNNNSSILHLRNERREN